MTDIPSLHYLQAAVKGGLRLHPPIPITRRLRGDGCKIGEFGLPEETAVLINLYSIPRDPEAWDNPDEFCPERFLVCPVEQGNEMENKKAKFWFCSVWRRKKTVSWCKIGLHFDEYYSCSYGSMPVWKIGTDEDGAKFNMQ